MGHSNARCPASCSAYVCRLNALGYDYRAVLDERHIRVLVRRREIDEILEWFADLELNAKSRSRPSAFPRRRQLRLLVAIPLGGGLGSLVANLLGHADPTFAALSAICASVLALLLPASQLRVGRNESHQ